MLQCCRAGDHWPLAGVSLPRSGSSVAGAGAGVWTRLYTPTLCSTADMERWRHPVNTAELQRWRDGEGRYGGDRRVDSHHAADWRTVDNLQYTHYNGDSLTTDIFIEYNDNET